MISTDWKPEFYHWRIREEEGVVAAEDTIGGVKNAKKYPAVKVEILFEKYKHVNMLKYEWREMLECEEPASCQEITGQWIRMFQLSDQKSKGEREDSWVSLGPTKTIPGDPRATRIEVLTITLTVLCTVTVSLDLKSYFSPELTIPFLLCHLFCFSIALFAGIVGWEGQVTFVICGN